MRIILGLVLTLLAGNVVGQEVSDCSGLRDRGVIPAQGEMNGRSYANGEVTLGVVSDGDIDTGDSLFLLVYAPQEDGSRSCHMIGMEQGRGYANIGLRAAEADYDAATGLTVDVPARIFLFENGFTNSTVLSVNVNRVSNEVTVTQELGGE